MYFHSLDSSVLNYFGQYAVIAVTKSVLFLRVFEIKKLELLSWEMKNW